MREELPSFLPLSLLAFFHLPSLPPFLTTSLPSFSLSHFLPPSLPFLPFFLPLPLPRLGQLTKARAGVGIQQVL